MSDHEETAKGWVFLILIWLGGYAIYGGYEWLSSSGWIPHQVETTITAEPNWMVGESKTCTSNPMDAETAKILNKPVDYALFGINCDDGSWHRITATFWGKEIQKNKKITEWNCTRTSDSFTCKQIGAE